MARFFSKLVFLKWVLLISLTFLIMAPFFPATAGPKKQAEAASQVQTTAGQLSTVAGAYFLSQGQYELGLVLIAAGLGGIYAGALNKETADELDGKPAAGFTPGFSDFDGLGAELPDKTKDLLNQAAQQLGKDKVKDILSNPDKNLTEQDKKLVSDLMDGEGDTSALLGGGLYGNAGAFPITGQAAGSNSEYSASTTPGFAGYSGAGGGGFGFGGSSDSGFGDVLAKMFGQTGGEGEFYGNVALSELAQGPGASAKQGEEKVAGEDASLFDIVHAYVPRILLANAIAQSQIQEKQKAMADKMLGLAKVIHRGPAAGEKGESGKGSGVRE